MEQRLDLATRRLVIGLETDAALDERLEKGDSLGWIVRLEERLEEGEELSVLLTGGRRAVLLETRIRQIFRSGRDLWGTILDVASQAEVERPPVEEPRTPEQEKPAEEESEEVSEEVDHSESRGTSSIFEIKKLKMPEKVRLASRANHQQRKILLRDSSPQVALGLLNNPQIEAKEVLELVKNPQAASGVLQRIGQDRRWIGNYEVLLAIVKNPRTPSPLAVRFVDQLRRSDLRHLAKSQALRENIRKAILRVYLKRSP